MSSLLCIEQRQSRAQIIQKGNGMHLHCRILAREPRLASLDQMRNAMASLATLEHFDSINVPLTPFKLKDSLGVIDSPNATMTTLYDKR